MSKILLLVATVLILLSAGLTFVTKGKLSGLRTELASTQESVTQKTSEIAKLNESQKLAEEALATEKAKSETAEAELASSTQALDKAQADLTNANQQLETAKAEVVTLNEKIASMPTSTGGVDSTGAIAADDAETQLQLKEAQTQLAEAQQLNDSLTSKVADMEGQMTSLRQKAEQRDRQLMAKGLEGQVLAVNAAWNFVVVSIGDRQGVVPNAEMIVMRGGQQVGKVRITSVEPSTSIADVIPGSTSRGESVRPGDRVIYPGA